MSYLINIRKSLDLKTNADEKLLIETNTTPYNYWSVYGISKDESGYNFLRDFYGHICEIAFFLNKESYRNLLFSLCYHNYAFKCGNSFEASTNEVEIKVDIPNFIKGRTFDRLKLALYYEKWFDLHPESNITVSESNYFDCVKLRFKS